MSVRRSGSRAGVWLRAAAVLLAGFTGLATASGTPTLRRFEYVEPHMGTTFRVVLYARTATQADRAVTEAFARIAALDARLSDYRDASELSQLTKRAVGQSIPVSRDLFRVLDAGQRLAARTEGAFDLTVGPLTRLWRRAHRQGQLPPESELADALAVTGYRKLVLNRRARTARVAVRGMQLDAGGIAKGYAADAALAVLGRHGIRRALVAAGGDIRMGEPPPGAEGWQIVLAGLDPERSAPGSPLTLAGCGVSTSGDAEQWVEIDGRRYSHIVDPRTGLGLTGHRSVTVVAANAMTSDMLATAVTVLGPREGIALVDSYRNAAALVGVVAATGEEWHQSRRWDQAGISGQ